MTKKNIRLKTHLGNGVYDTLHPETNSQIVKVGDKNLDETLNEVTTQLAQTATPIDVSFSDGIKDTLNEFNAIKSGAFQGGTIKFSQNKTGDAVYYFSANPDMSEILIDSDAGVVLSFPTTGIATTFKTWKFLKPIKIYLRDRDNTSEIFANYETDFIASILSTGDISQKVGITNPVVSDATAFIKQRRFTSNDEVSVGSSIFTSSNQVDWDLSTVSGGAIDYVEQPAVIGREYLASFTAEEAGTSYGGERGGLVVTYEGGFAFSSIDRLSNYYLGIKNTSSPWSETSELLPTEAYGIGPETNTILSVFVTGQKTVEFYINGWRVSKLTLYGNIKSIGFGCYSGGQSGKAQCFDFITSDSNDKQVGDNLNIFISGDSLSFGEAVGMDWPTMLKSILVGQYGIYDVSIDNKAVSGQKAVEQLAVIKASDLSSYDYTLILVGSNDIIQQTSMSAFRQTIVDMINSVKNKGSVPIIGIPPMYIDQSLTGKGFYAANYAKGAIYRSAIYRIAAEQKITVADTLSEIGKVGVDNTQLRDNLHLQSKTNAFVAKSFARTILSNEINKTVILPKVVRTGDNTIYWLSAMPSSGYYAKADIVYNTNPSILGASGSQYTVIGWRRIVSGTSNVLNTDWVEMRAITGA